MKTNPVILHGGFGIGKTTVVADCLKDVDLRQFTQPFKFVYKLTDPEVPQMLKEGDLNLGPNWPLTQKETSALSIDSIKRVITLVVKN